MTITNGYLTLDEAKQTIDANTAVHDQRLEEAIEAASRQIDGWCKRSFYTASSVASAKVFVAENYCPLSMPDVSTGSGLVLQIDTGGDGVYETTWTVGTQFQLEPLNQELEGLAWPYTTIRTLAGAAFPRSLDGRPNVKVTAVWGWPAVPTDVKIACRLQTTRLFSAQKAPFGVIQVEDGFNARMPQVHPEVKALLAPYRKHQVLVA